MISKKEADRIVREYDIETTIKGYSGPLKNWKGEVSILNYPEIASKILTKEAILIMHPGSYCDYGLIDVPPHLLKSYNDYINRLKSAIHRLELAIHPVLSKKAVLIFPEYGRKKETLEFLGVHRDSVVLVPTEGRPSSDPCAKLRYDILQIGEVQFPYSLYEYVQFAKLWGEKRDACGRDLRNDLDPPIEIQVIDELTFL